MRVSQNHPRFREIKAYAENRLNNEFNNQQMDNVETVLEKAGTSISELIVKPSFKVLALEWLGDLSDKEESDVYREYLEDRDPEPAEEDLVEEAEELYVFLEKEDVWYFIETLSPEHMTGPYNDKDAAKEDLGAKLLDEWKVKRESLIQRLVKEHPEILDEYDFHEDCSEEDFYEWLEEDRTYSEDVEEHFDDSQHFPMWNILFEANARWMSEKLEEMVDELYAIGIGVIGSSDEFEAMMFIGGAGYDFYEAHWIPLFIKLGWLDLTKYPEPDKQLAGCNHCGHDEFVYSVEMVVITNPVDLGDLGKGCKLSTPAKKENPYPKVLRCTNCGTEHSESNFVWEV